MTTHNKDGVSRRGILLVNLLISQNLSSQPASHSKFPLNWPDKLHPRTWASSWVTPHNKSPAASRRASGAPPSPASLRSVFEISTRRNGPRPLGGPRSLNGGPWGRSERRLRDFGPLTLKPRQRSGLGVSAATWTLVSCRSWTLKAPPWVS